MQAKSQQQHSTITLTADVPNATITTSSYATPESGAVLMKSFPSHQAVWLSITLIVAGVASIAFNITDLAVGFSGSSKFTWGAVAHGIWTGTMCVSTGIVGLVAAKTKTRKWVRGFLVDSLIASALTSAQFIVGMIGATVPSGAHCWNFSGNCDAVLTAMQALLAAMAVVEAVAAIWSACICCKSSVTVPESQTMPGTAAVQVQSNVVPSYHSYQSTTVGIILIVAGMCSWAFNIADLIVGLTNWNYYYFTWGQVGHGLWTGIVCVAAGAVGIETAKNKTKPFILSFHVLCIAAMVCSTGQFVVGILGVVDPPYIDQCSFSVSCDDVLIAMEGCLIAMASIQASVAIWGSIVCCSAYCCVTHQAQSTVAYHNHGLSQNISTSAQQVAPNVYQVVLPPSSHSQTIQVVVPQSQGGASDSGPPAYDSHAYQSPPNYADDVKTNEKSELH